MSVFAEAEATMEALPHGPNHGRVKRPISPHSDASADPRDPWRSLSVDGTEQFLQDGGWLIESGTAHRGVLHPDEHVDAAGLSRLVASYLGFSLDEITRAYQNGRPTAVRASVRAQIDARLLALSRSGGNMTALAQALGWSIDAKGACWKLKKALERARRAEG